MSCSLILYDNNSNVVEWQTMTNSVTGDAEGHTAHVVVVCGDDPAEGDLVAGSRRCKHACPVPICQPRHNLHTSYSLEAGHLSPDAATIAG